MSLQDNPEHGYLEMSVALQPDGPAGISFSIQFDDLDYGMEQGLRIFLSEKEGIEGSVGGALLDAEVVDTVAHEGETQTDKDGAGRPCPELDHAEVGKGAQESI